MSVYSFFELRQRGYWDVRGPIERYFEGSYLFFEAGRGCGICFTGNQRLRGIFGTEVPDSY